MKASDRIPVEKRADVIRLVMHVQRNLDVNPDVWEWLIEVYNAYYCPNPEKKATCRTDKNTVLKALYANVLIWKKQEEKTLQKQ